jgi:NADPH:quinone reductase-like Zn-dependent oxidoreductase
MRGAPAILRVLFRVRTPKMSRPGVDMAGQIEAVGKNVTRFKPGDEVFGVCQGAFAEYACASETDLALKPANLTFEQAAAVPIAAFTALQALRNHGQIRAGQKVLVNGAAGGVGTFAVQIARSFGAEVTGVCSTRNVDLVRSLGADRVVDYTREDFTRDEQRYDLILDCVGNHPLSACRRVLAPEGRLVIVGGKKIGTILARMLQARVWSPFLRQKLLFFMAKRSQEDLAVLRDLLEAGKVTPVLDRTYPLKEVPDALRYLEEGHARGKVVITV